MTAEHTPAHADRKLLIGACGSAGVLTLPTYLVTLKNQLGCQITTVLSRSASQFLPARSLGLLCDTTIDGSDPAALFDANHVQLATGHDAVLILPATAHILAEAAHGLGTSAIGTILLATPGPAIFVPSMNQHMWANQAVQRNVTTLREYGHQVIEPELKPTYELASKQTVTAPVMPSPRDLADMLGNHFNGSTLSNQQVRIDTPV